MMQVLNLSMNRSGRAKLTKIGKNLQNIKNKYTNVYLIRSSMENGLNKYIYKK